jgi:hypothetical protein
VTAELPVVRAADGAFLSITELVEEKLESPK